MGPVGDFGTLSVHLDVQQKTIRGDQRFGKQLIESEKQG